MPQDHPLPETYLTKPISYPSLNVPWRGAMVVVVVVTAVDLLCEESGYKNQGDNGGA